MSPVRELDAALERLFRRNLHTIKLDLAPMRDLMAWLGNPQDGLLFVHVAGTNGKGSVCTMLAAMLRAQGYRTGLYTSPHLVRFNERIQINGEAISDERLQDLIDEVEQAAKKLRSSGQRDVTFFEFTTALAMLYFAREKTDIVVLETGMGGRLDATNIIVPALSVITSIGFDHMAYLGDTLAKIAAEKSGIIKRGRPVVLGPVAEEARAVIHERARSLAAPVRAADQLVHITARSFELDGQIAQVVSEQDDYGSVKMKMTGIHQLANAAIAVAAAECLDREVGVPLKREAIKQGLAEAYWPARNQLISLDPPMILDGAHNAEAAAALAAWLKKVAGKRPLGMVAGFLADKDPEAFLVPFRGRIRHLWLTPVQSERAMDSREAARRLADVPQLEVSPDLASSLAAAKTWARDESGLIVITGSLYLAGEVLATMPG
ncbi:MAG: bifunctional folylpolyglutamate synthase/dihydrofolate synthase [Kiritimatiellia bacterium]